MSSTKFYKDIEKGNGTDVVRVAVDHFEGHDLINIRTWFKPPDEDGLRPTSKGIAIPAGLYDELMEALQEVKEYI